MKLRSRLQNNSWIPYTVAACSAVVVYVCLMNLDFFRSILARAFSYVSPVLYSVIFAYLLDPIVRYVENRWLKNMKNRQAARVIGVIFTVVLLLAVLAVLCVAFLPHLIGSVELLVTNLESYVETAHKTLTELPQSIPFLGQYLENNMEWSELVRSILEWLPQNVPAILDTSMRIGSGLFNAVIVFIISLYMLIDKGRLIGGIKVLIKLFVTPRQYRPLQRFFRHCDHILLRYVGSDLLDGLLIGVLNFLFMLLMKMPYALLISVIVGVTNLVPTFGPFAGAALGGLILVLMDPLMAMWFLIWILFLQLMDGYVIKPHLFGDTMGLPAVWVLVSIIVGSRVLGMLGVLLAVPVASIIAYLLQILIRKKQLANAAAQAEQAADDAEDAAEAARTAAAEAVRAAEAAEAAAQEAEEAADAVEEAADAVEEATEQFHS